MTAWLRLIRHRWLDASDTCRVVPDDMAQRLAQRVSASEARHSGEVVLCVEAALPAADVWRSLRTTPMAEVVRDRALGWYGRLGVWDTEHNNGVLIYLLLAEHAIEVVADRALARRVAPQDWQAMVDRLGHQLRAGLVEEGLTQALEEVSALLVEHFPSTEGADRLNELPDCVVRA